MLELYLHLALKVNYFMNINKQQGFKRTMPPLVLCSGSTARRAFLAELSDIIVYPFPKNGLTFGESILENTVENIGAGVSKTQHFKIIQKKWEATQRLLSGWSGPMDLRWSKYVTIVCDTLVYVNAQGYGKPTSTNDIQKWFQSYLQHEVTVTTLCIIGWMVNGEVQAWAPLSSEGHIHFTPKAKREIPSFLSSPISTFHRPVAGGIDVEWFQKLGWVDVSPSDLDTIIGIPWSHIRNEIEAREWKK